MADRENSRKQSEFFELELFLDARAWVTRDGLSIIRTCESPDFLCASSAGSIIGVELARVMRNPVTAWWEWILERQVEMDIGDVLWTIHSLIEKKESLRASLYLLKTSETILVLQHMDASIGSLGWALNERQGEFSQHGFTEIWLADYSGAEAYGDIELFGLHPSRWWGYHVRPCPQREPYG